MRKINGYLFIPYILWMLLFVVIPVILLIYFSMIDIHGHFNLDNYKQIMTTKYFRMIWDSIMYATAITIMTLCISYPAAYFIRISKYQSLWLCLAQSSIRAGASLCPQKTYKSLSEGAILLALQPAWSLVVFSISYCARRILGLPQVATSATVFKRNTRSIVTYCVMQPWLLRESIPVPWSQGFPLCQPTLDHDVKPCQYQCFTRKLDTWIPCRWCLRVSIRRQCVFTWIVAGFRQYIFRRYSDVSLGHGFTTQLSWFL